MAFPFHLVQDLPSQVATPSDWDLAADACCGLDEFLSFRNDFFLELGYTELFWETVYRFAVTVMMYHPEYQEQLAFYVSRKYRERFRTLTLESVKSEYAKVKDTYW